MSMYDDQIEGFQELLDGSGIVLTFKGAPVSAKVSRDGNDSQPFDLDPGDCQTVVISCFKPGVEVVGYSVLLDNPATGNYFEDDEGGRYRVKARRPNPGRPVAKFICEYSGGE